MVRVGIVLVLWAYLSLAAAAQIIATVDRNVVGVNEAIRLTFEADGDTGDPDFSPLRKHFEILDRSQSQNLSILNGRTSRTMVWDLILMATQPGTFRIPPISFGADQSQAIEITVQETDTTEAEDRTIYLKVEVDEKQPYVQQQILFTVKLFRAVEVASATLSELEVQGLDAIVERFGDDKDYQILQNGRRWRVVERKYVVFPQHSGYMTIKPLRFRGSIVPRQSNLGFSIFNQSLSKPIVLQSESVTLQVREPPASFAGSWLPAREVTIEETWPKQQSVNVGDPITRTVSVRALGLTAAQLPSLQAELPIGLRGYPEQPRLENTGQSTGVLGMRTETVAMIPTQPGTFTLPELQLKWWNLDKQQPELATIPARTFEVLSTTPVTEAAEAPEAVSVVESGADPQQEPATLDSAAQAASWWHWLTAGLAVAWLVTIAFWILDRRRASNSGSRRTDTSEPVRVTQAQALVELKAATSTGDMQATRDALLGWGEAMSPTSPPRNLGELARRCGGSIAEQIAGLEQALYAGEGAWDRTQLLRAVLDYKPPANSDGDSRQALEPLFRT